MKRKVFCILLFLLLVTVSYNAFATDLIGEVKNGMKPVMNADTSSTEMNNTLANIIKVIQYVGSGIALIVITIYGIKYMLSSPAEKADVKKQILPIIIGCTLVFGAVNIVSLIFSISDKALPK